MEKVHYTCIRLDTDSEGRLQNYADDLLSEFKGGALLSSVYCGEVIIEMDPITVRHYPFGQHIDMTTTEIVADDFAQVAMVNVHGLYPRMHGAYLPFQTQPFVAISAAADVDKWRAGHVSRQMFGVRRIRHKINLTGVVSFFDGENYHARHPRDESASRLSAPYVVGSDTSKAAAAFIAPKSKAIKEKILNFILTTGGKGATDDEIEQAMGLRHQTASPRRRELVQAGKLRESGEKRRTRSGRWAKVWVPTWGTRQMDMFGS